MQTTSRWGSLPAPLCETILVTTLGHLHTLTPLQYLTCALSKEHAHPNFSHLDFP